jgi:uncharacterized protein (TIGR03067 family)
MRSVKLQLCAVVLLLISPILASAGEAPSELQGTWKLVSVETQGESKELGERQPRLVIKGDTATHAGAKTATMTVDTTATPKIIDLRLVNPDRTYEGIYSVEGDTLKICVNKQTEGAKERPESFSTKNHDSWTLLVFERDKNDGEQGASGFAGVQLGFNKDRNEVFVVSALKGSPAEKAGLRKDDFVLKIGGAPVNELRAAVDAVRRFKPGDEVNFLVRRDSKEIEIKLKVELLPFSIVAQLD